MKNDSSKLQSTITKWCSEAFERLEEFDVGEAEKVLKSALELTDPSSEQANFMGSIFLSNSSIGSVTAKQLKGTRVLFNNDTAIRVNSLATRLQQLSSDVQQVNSKIRFTMATQRSKRETPPLMIEKLFVSEGMEVETINGHPITDLVYKLGRRNRNLRDIIANEVLITSDLFVKGEIDGIELKEDNVILERESQVLRPFSIDNLTVSTAEGVGFVNGLPFDEFFMQLRRKVDRKMPNNINELNVVMMSVEQLINKKNFTSMARNSLKTAGDQTLLAPTNIRQLKANRIMFAKPLQEQMMSEVPLSMLISINDSADKLTHINQDIRFADELNVNRLTVSGRINNINVVEGQLQVLRKQGPPEQVVTGEKFFDQVVLKSPIQLQGKIESKTLEKMNPVITIDENLEIEGDYKIDGPVVVRRVINVTDDIGTLNPKLGLKNLVDNGLNLITTSATSNRLVFENFLDVRRNLQAGTLNQKPVANFVKADYPQMQVIGGLKTFKKGLMVNSGSVQADFINDVDMSHLNLTTLKRASRATQFIDGNVEVVSLKTAQLVSPNPTIGGKNINLILNANKIQDLSKMTLNHAAVKNINATNLNQAAGGKIFTHDVNFLIDDTVTKDSPVDNVIVGVKKFSDLSVGRLIFSENNEWKSVIANYESFVAEDIHVNESWRFPKDLKIGNLEVKGTINDVTYHDMSYNWLQVEGDQVFTSPQTIGSMTVDNNLALVSGAINGENLNRMISESIWIDEEVSVENVEVDGDITVRGEVSSPSVNGISLERKLILNNTNEHQTLKKLFIERHIAIEYINFTNLNGIDCERFMTSFAGDNGAANLMVQGTATFNYQPNIVSLNNENLEHLHDSIWMSDRDVMLTGEDIRFLGGVTSNGDLYSDVS